MIAIYCNQLRTKGFETLVRYDDKELAIEDATHFWNNLAPSEKNNIDFYGVVQVDSNNNIFDTIRTFIKGRCIP